MKSCASDHIGLVSIYHHNAVEKQSRKKVNVVDRTFFFGPNRIYCGSQNINASTIAAPRPSSIAKSFCVQSAATNLRFTSHYRHFSVPIVAVVGGHGGPSLRSSRQLKAIAVLANLTTK